MEQNMAPKWMEGNYMLTIKGNKVSLASPTGSFGQVETYTARCSPDDRFAIEDAMTVVFQRKYDDEMKIKVGDKVKVGPSTLSYDLYTAWVDSNVTSSIHKCKFAFGNGSPSPHTHYIVRYIAKHNDSPDCDEYLAYIQSECGYDKCYLVDLNSLEKVME